MKMVIWDLDETLWDGTIVYGDTIKLKPETKEVLKQLDKLGIIQCVCTHNSEDMAIKEIEKQGLIKYFKHIEGSIVKEKDEMIKNILAMTKIAPEETLFIDDAPINRALVYEKLGVHVDYCQDLYEVMKYFDTNMLVLMNQQRNRTNAEKKWTGDFKEFLKKINNKITIKLAEANEVGRITELANRTNELNSTRTRYQDEEIAGYVNGEDFIVLVAYLSDDFGDYGLVGEIICEKIVDTTPEIFIRDICVSCRTMGRGVGKALIEEVKKLRGDNRLTGLLIQNEFNAQMKALFESCGFIPYEVDGNKIWYELK